MEKNLKNKKVIRVISTTLSWLGFILLELILTAFNLFFIFAIYFYFSYCFGSEPRIEPESQTVEIKKVDGFYLVQGLEYNDYAEKPFPDCKIKFHNKILEFKKGDIYDGKKLITDKVTIAWTKAGYRVYYLKKSFPLQTIGTFDASYRSKYNRDIEKKGMYAKNGILYVDVDERHEIITLILLVALLVLIIIGWKAINSIVQEKFTDQYDLTIGRLYDLQEKVLQKSEKKEDNE